MPVSIYGLVDPRCDEVRYVGKASGSPHNRLNAHLSTARTRKSSYPVQLWIRDLLALGLKPSLVVLESDPSSWQEAEIRWIAYYRKLYGRDVMKNISDGGDLLTMDWSALSPEERTARAKRLWEKRRANGKGTWTLSPEVAKSLARPHSEETKAKMRQTRQTPEFKEKISEIRRGRRHSDESKAKMSAAHSGRPKSEETKAKMREAQRLRRERERSSS